LQFHTSKLNPENTAFFQYPKRKWSPSGPLGIKKLGMIMKEMSEAPGLSKNYTNHPVRATTITLWSNASLSNRHIMAISGHRNEQSLRSYNARPSSAQLQHSSDVLSNALGATSAPSTSVQIHPQAPQAQIYITPECPVVLQKCHLQQHVLGLLDWQHASGRQTTREVDETRSIYNA